MKFFVFSLALLVAGASAVPHNAVEDAKFMNAEQRFVDDAIRDIIRKVQDFIVERNLDPLIIDRFEYAYDIPLFMNVKAFINDLEFRGASDIKVNDLEYSLVFNILRFDIELPHLSLVIGNSGIDAEILENHYSISLSGSSSVSRIRVIGDVRFLVGIFDISVRSLSLQVSVGNISSDHSLILFGDDLSAEFNNFLNNSIPELLRIYENEINQLLSDVAKVIVDIILRLI